MRKLIDLGFAIAWFSQGIVAGTAVKNSDLPNFLLAAWAFISITWYLAQKGKDLSEKKFNNPF